MVYIIKTTTTTTIIIKILDFIIIIIIDFIIIIIMIDTYTNKHNSDEVCIRKYIYRIFFMI